jgi:hypothetical protein
MAILIFLKKYRLPKKIQRQFPLKVKEAGDDVTFREGEGMVHCWPRCSPKPPKQ